MKIQPPKNVKTLDPPPPPKMSQSLEEENTTPPPPPQQQRYPLSSIGSTILIRQIPSEGIAFQLWPASAALVSLLNRHRLGEPTPLSSLLPSSSRRPRLLELGSGTGILGIAAAALLGACVTVTDLPNVLPNLRFNAEANAGVVAAQGGEVHVAALSWGDPPGGICCGGEYDFIVGSDVVYHEHLYEPLLVTLKGLMGREREVVFLMAHMKRWKKESGFFKKANKFFHVELVHTDAPCEGARLGVALYTFVRRKRGSLNILSV